MVCHTLLFQRTGSQDGSGTAVATFLTATPLLSLTRSLLAQSIVEETPWAVALLQRSLSGMREEQEGKGEEQEGGRWRTDDRGDH